MVPGAASVSGSAAEGYARFLSGRHSRGVSVMATCPPGAGESALAALRELQRGNESGWSSQAHVLPAGSLDGSGVDSSDDVLLAVGLPGEAWQVFASDPCQEWVTGVGVALDGYGSPMRVRMSDERMVSTVVWSEQGPAWPQEDEFPGVFTWVWHDGGEHAHFVTLDGRHSSSNLAYRSIIGCPPALAGIALRGVIEAPLTQASVASVLQFAARYSRAAYEGVVPLSFDQVKAGALDAVIAGGWAAVLEDQRGPRVLGDLFSPGELAHVHPAVVGDVALERTRHFADGSVREVEKFCARHWHTR